MEITCGVGGRGERTRAEETREDIIGAVIHRIGCGIEKKRKSRMVQCFEPEQ